MLDQGEDVEHVRYCKSGVSRVFNVDSTYNIDEINYSVVPDLMLDAPSQSHFKLSQGGDESSPYEDSY